MTGVEECQHQWQKGFSQAIRRGIKEDHGWDGYDYCPKCHAFREHQEGTS